MAALSRGTVGWSAVCDCDISRSYSPLLRTADPIGHKSNTSWLKNITSGLIQESWEGPLNKSGGWLQFVIVVFPDHTQLLYVCFLFVKRYSA